MSIPESEKMWSILNTILGKLRESIVLSVLGKENFREVLKTGGIDRRPKSLVLYWRKRRFFQYLASVVHACFSTFSERTWLKSMVSQFPFGTWTFVEKRKKEKRSERGLNPLLFFQKKTDNTSNHSKKSIKFFKVVEKRDYKNRLLKKLNRDFFLAHPRQHPSQHRRSWSTKCNNVR